VSFPAARGRHPTREAVLRWLPGLAVTALALFLLSRFVDWRQFIEALVSIPPAIILFTVALYLVSVLIRSAGWQLLLQRKVTLYQAVITLNEGCFFNNLLPFRIGEVARGFLMGRRSGLGLFHVLSTIVVERSYDLAITVGIFLATLPLAFRLDWAGPAAALLLVLIGAGLLVLFLAARRRGWVEAKAARLGVRWRWFGRWVRPHLRSLLDGFSLFNRVEYFAGSLVLIFAAWMLAVFRDWILIRELVPQAPFWWAALGVSAANIAGAVPSVMGALGTYELGGTSALTLVGMSGEAALAYLLIEHVIHLAISTGIGAYGLSQEGQTLASLYADIRHSRQAG